MLDYHQTEMRNIAKNKQLGQFIAPTGTGKSVVQANIIADNIVDINNFGIYLVLTPRILLTNQLMDSVAKPLIKKGIGFKRIVVHSGTASEAGLTDDELAQMSRKEVLRYLKTLAFADSTTRATSAEIKDDIRSAINGNYPIVMCSTYHSVEKITNAIEAINVPVNITLCDEAHHVVQPTFHESVVAISDKSKKTFFFTATRKVTASDDGRGMNNEKIYGEVLAQYTPIEMIEKGYIVMPKLHFVDVTGDSDCVGDAVARSFEEHRKHVNGNAKLLVSCSGSQQLEQILNDSSFKSYISNNKNKIKIFDITALWGARINGKVVERNDFLTELRNYKGLAIVLHLHILTEGIDITDMSGTMLLGNPTESKFYQLVGRGTRLDVNDRAGLTDGTITPVDKSKWNKPYCYVIIPVFNDEGIDNRATMMTLIEKMRDYTNNMSEIVLVNKNKGTSEDEIPETLNDTNTSCSTIFSELFDIIQYLEEIQRKAVKLKDIEDSLVELI